MIVLLPSAGYATRLYPLTENTPKALLEVAAKPMIEHVLDKISELPPVTKIIVISNQKFFGAFNAWAGKYRKTHSVPLVVLNDKTDSNENRLGAIGDVQFAIEQEKIDDDVLWISSDNFFNFSLKPAFDQFKKTSRDLIALYDVKTMDEAKKMGIVSVDSNGKVVAFKEKPSEPASTLASIGIYFYTRETVASVSRYLSLGLSPDKPGEFVEWLYKEKTVLSHTYGGARDEWYDVGSHDMLNFVRNRFQKPVKKK